MGRVNYLIRLIIRVIFVLLCFVLTFSFIAIGFSNTDEIAMTNSTQQPNCIITTKNGATVDCSVKNNILILDIVQDGGEFDDIIITLNTDPVEYNTSFLEKIMRNKPQHAQYVDNMKEGPWSAILYYRLMGDSVLTTGDKSFRIQYDTKVYNTKISSKLANTNDSSGKLKIQKDDVISLSVTMGTAASGALPSGKYSFFMELDIMGLYEGDNVKLSYGESIPVLINIAKDALKSVPLKSIFSVSSWLTFYFMMVVFGCVFFAYSDLRAAYKIATSGISNVVVTVYYVFINGCYSGQVYDYSGTSSFSLIGFILVYLFLLLTIPIRIAMQIINSIVRLFIGDEYSDSDPIFSNILGCIAVYLIIFSIVGLICATSGSLEYAPVIIAGIVGIGLLILAVIMSNRKEDM